MFDVQDSGAAARVGQSGGSYDARGINLNALTAPQRDSGLIGRFIDHCNSADRLTTPNSLRVYTRALEQFKDYLVSQYGHERGESTTTVDQLLLRATSSDVEGFLDQFSAKGTFNVKATVLRNFYRFLVDKEGLDKNPVTVKSKKLAVSDSPKRLLTSEEQAALLKPISFSGMRAMDVRSIILAQLVFATGQRAFTLAALKIENVKVNGSDSVTIAIPLKSSKYRLVTIEGPIAEKFQEYLKWREDYLEVNSRGRECPSVFFTTKTLNPIGDRSMRRGLAEIQSKIGLSSDISFGEIRFTKLVEMIKSNMRDPFEDQRDSREFYKYLKSLGFFSNMIQEARLIAKRDQKVRARKISRGNQKDLHP